MNSLPIAVEHQAGYLVFVSNSLLRVITACCRCGYHRVSCDGDAGDDDADAHGYSPPGCSSCLSHASSGFGLSGHQACYCFDQRLPQRTTERTRTQEVRKVSSSVCSFQMLGGISLPVGFLRRYVNAALTSPVTLPRGSAEKNNWRPVHNRGHTILERCAPLVALHQRYCWRLSEFLNENCGRWIWCSQV